MLPFVVTATDTASRARLGVLTTAHGTVQTPAFMPVGTRATVTGLDPLEVASMGAQMNNPFGMALTAAKGMITGNTTNHREQSIDAKITVVSPDPKQAGQMVYRTLQDQLSDAGRAMPAESR